MLGKLSDAGRIGDVVIKQILSQRHTGFSVFWGKQIAPDDEDSLLFLCRYIDRGPISLDKISFCDDIITYATKDDLTHEFSPTEFLAHPVDLICVCAAKLFWQAYYLPQE